MMEDKKKPRARSKRYIKMDKIKDLIKRADERTKKYRRSRFFTEKGIDHE